MYICLKNETQLQNIFISPINRKELILLNNLRCLVSLCS